MYKGLLEVFEATWLFNKLGKQDVTTTPRWISEKDVHKQVQLIKEEVEEIEQAFRDKDRFELRPMLSRFNDFCTYNIYWGMDEVTKGYYIKDPKLEKTTNDSGAILKEVKSKLNS